MWKGLSKRLFGGKEGSVASWMGPLRLSALGGPVLLLATDAAPASWSPEGALGELHPCLGFWRRGPWIDAPQEPCLAAAHLISLFP